MHIYFTELSNFTSRYFCEIASRSENYFSCTIYDIFYFERRRTTVKQEWESCLHTMSFIIYSTSWIDLATLIKKILIQLFFLRAMTSAKYFFIGIPTTVKLMNNHEYWLFVNGFFQQCNVRHAVSLGEVLRSNATPGWAAFRATLPARPFCYLNLISN